MTLLSNRVTQLRPRSNETSEQIRTATDVITDVIPRDTGLSTERYAIFTDNADDLPDSVKTLLDEFELELINMDDHAIDYRHGQTREQATHLARKTSR